MTQTLSTPPTQLSAYAARVNTRIGDERYHRCMSDSPTGAFPPAPGQPWGPPPPAAATAPDRTLPAPPMAFRRPARWPTFTAMVIALIGVAVGLVGWFRPAAHNDQTSTPPRPTYTDQQIADAKAHMCTAFGKVDHALGVADARKGGSDPTAGLAVATSTRQVFEVGSRYLLTKLGEDPATPPDLTDAFRRLANSYQEAVVGYLADASDSELRPSLNNADEATLTIRRLCK